MSYILEALRKSEQERQSYNEVPSIQTVHNTFAPKDHRPPLQKIVVAACLLLIVLYIIHYWQFAEINNDSVVEPSPMRIKTLPKNDNSEITDGDMLPKKILPVITNRLVGTESYPATSSDHLSVNKGSLNKQVEALYTENPDKQPQVTDAILTAIKAPTVKPKALTGEGSIGVVEQTAPMISEFKTPASIIPFIDDIAWSIKENIPSIEYTAHIFAENSGSGFVILNGAKKHAGEGFRNGMYVEKIETDSVTLSYNGVLFKLAAMKSWIN